MSVSPSPDPNPNGPDTQRSPSVTSVHDSSANPSATPPPRPINDIIPEVNKILLQFNKDKDKDPSIFYQPPKAENFKNKENKHEKIKTLEKFKEKIFFPRAEKIVCTTHHTFLEQNKTKRTNLLTHTSAFLIYFCPCFIVNSLFTYFKIVFE